MWTPALGRKGERMKKKLFISLIILLISLCFLACKNNKINKDAQSITVKNNNFSQKFISKNFKNLNEIIFEKCKMERYDLSKIGDKIEIIKIKYSDSSELYLTDICTCSKLIIEHSEIKQLNLEKFPNIKQLSTWYTPIESCYIPYKNEIQRCSFINSKIDDLQSLKTLRNVIELDITQENLNKDYDVSFIKDFSFLTKARFSSNFYVTDDILNVIDLQIDGVENFNSISSVMKFKNLQELYYCLGYEESFPIDLFNLKELEKLTFFETKIKDFPIDFTNFRKLKELTIISFMEIIMSKDILMPASLTDFYTNISCEDIDYCKKNNPNVNFHCDLEV